MGRFSVDLAGLPPQFEVRSEAEKWKGAQQATQKVMREQGQVMSAALTNNRSLWETNKVLRREKADLIATCQRLERERNELQRLTDAIPSDLLDRAELQKRNEELEAGNALLRREMAGSLYPELDTDQRKEALERVRAQEAEIQAAGIVPTPQEIARADFDRDQRGVGYSFDPASLPKT